MMNREEGIMMAEPSTIQEEMLRLRARIRRLSIVTSILVAGLALLTILFVINWQRTTYAMIGPDERLVVRGLQIQDDQGRVRATLTTTPEDGAYLILEDGESRQVVVAAPNDKKPHITLFGPTGEPQLHAGATPDGPGLGMYGTDGVLGFVAQERGWHVYDENDVMEGGYRSDPVKGRGFYLRDAEGRTRSQWMFDGSTAEFRIFDADGRVVADAISPQ